MFFDKPSTSISLRLCEYQLKCKSCKKTYYKNGLNYPHAAKQNNSLCDSCFVKFCNEQGLKIFKTKTLTREEGLGVVEHWKNRNGYEDLIYTTDEHLIIGAFFNPIVSYLFREYGNSKKIRSYIHSRFPNLSDIDRNLLDQTITRVQKFRKEKGFDDDNTKRIDH